MCGRCWLSGNESVFQKRLSLELGRVGVEDLPYRPYSVRMRWQDLAVVIIWSTKQRCPKEIQLEVMPRRRKNLMYVRNTFYIIHTDRLQIKGKITT